MRTHENTPRGHVRPDNLGRERPRSEQVRARLRPCPLDRGEHYSRVCVPPSSLVCFPSRGFEERAMEPAETKTTWPARGFGRHAMCHQGMADEDL